MIRPTPTIAAFAAPAALAACLAIVALPAAAQTQWQWRDANGRMVYSDVPPPSVPARSLIKVPDRFAGQFRPLPETPASGSAAPIPSAPAVVAVSSQPAPSAEAAFRQRREAQRQAEAEEAQRLQAQLDRQTRCTSLRNYAAALQQGRRTAVAAADGSLQPMDGAQREAELAKANEDLAKFCA